MCVVSVALQGLPPQVSERLSHWELQVASITICPSLPLATRSHPTALTNVLRQATDLHAPDIPVDLSGWDCTAELGAAAAADLPALSHLNMGVHLSGMLTSEALSTVLAMGQSIRRLAAKSLYLKDSDHAGAVWLWEKLTFYDDGKTLDLAELLRLPQPSTYQGPELPMLNVQPTCMITTTNQVSAAWKQA